MKNMDSYLIIERMKQAKGIREDKELAEIINVNSSNISKWRTRNAIPFETVVGFSIEYNLDLNWLVLGESKREQLATDEQMFLTAYRQLDQEQKVKLMMQMSGLGNSSNGVNFTANGSNNNQQIIHGSVGEVNGIKK